jgi:hypothetical protein
MKPNKIQSMKTRAAFAPSTLVEEDRTVEVIFGTDAEVRMSDWEIGQYMESMSFEEGHVRWERLNSGAPLLDNHNGYKGTRGVLGVIERAWGEGGVGKAIIRFSKQEDGERAFQEVKDGILTGVSFGYRVYKYERISSLEGELPKLRAIDWEGFEISLAPIQADINATVRNLDNDSNNVEIIDLSLQPEQEPITTIRTMETPIIEPIVAPAVDTVAIATAERSRIKEITDLCRKFKADDSVVSDLIDNGKTVEQARKVIMDAWTAKDANEGQRSTPVVTADETDKFRAAVTEGIQMRSNPNIEAKQGGDSFRGMSLLRLSEEVLQRNGVATKGLYGRELASRALATSDFPIILGATVNKSLQAEYQGVERTFQPFCRKTSISDLKTKTVGKLSGLLGNLEVIPEGGEYTADAMSEDKEAYGLTKYGKKIAITLETIINDDMDAFSRIPRAIAYEVGYKQSDIIYNILTSNPNMNDAVALFHSTHGNLGTAGAISSTTLAEAKKKMRQQTGLNGKFINVMPSFLVVGPDNEQEALQWMNASFSPSTVGNTNIYQGSMSVIVDPRITTKNWFMVAAPNSIDTIEYAFLDGQGDFYTETKQGFDVDGLEVKVRMFFAAKAIDHRGMYKNPYV